MSTRHVVRTIIASLVLGSLVLGTVSLTLPPIANSLLKYQSLSFRTGHTWISLSINASAAEAKDDEAATKWTCPMHPHYIADEMGTCPICGMDLVKLGTPSISELEKSAQKRSVITIAPETMQSMGVRIAKAEKSTFGRLIRSYGRVSENERLQTELTARLEGWVEDLRIRAVGDEVREGDLLFKLYAPEYIVSQRDFLAAQKRRESTRMKSVRTRLLAFGMQERAIDELARTGAVLEFVPFYAEIDGTVAMIDLRPGSYVKRGTILVRIQDYSQVWLIVSVPEHEIVFIKVGTPAKVTFPTIPGHESLAQVDYVYPTVDAETRTGQVRIVLENEDGNLRPGTYADVIFETDTQQRIAVPPEAILRSAGGQYVVVSLGEGHFEPRAVKVGFTSDRWVEISEGIEGGDDIVVSGQFLIDSESALRESFKKLERLQLPLSLLKLHQTQLASLDHMIDAAIYMHKALVGEHDIDPEQLESAIEVKILLWPAFQQTGLGYVMEDAVKALRKGQNAQAVSERQAALADLVTALEPWILDGAPQHYRDRKIVLYEDESSGRKWLQLAGEPNNPYGSGAAVMIRSPQSKIKAVSTSEDETGAPSSNAGFDVDVR